MNKFATRQARFRTENRSYSTLYCNPNDRVKHLQFTTTSNLGGFKSKALTLLEMSLLLQSTKCRVGLQNIELLEKSSKGDLLVFYLQKQACMDVVKAICNKGTSIQSKKNKLYRTLFCIQKASHGSCSRILLWLTFYFRKAVQMQNFAKYTKFIGYEPTISKWPQLLISRISWNRMNTRSSESIVVNHHTQSEAYCVAVLFHQKSLGNHLENFIWHVFLLLNSGQDSFFVMIPRANNMILRYGLAVTCNYSQSTRLVATPERE